MKERYDNLDGLRAISCLCIIAMHIKANADYQIEGWLFQSVIGSWGHLVALFLIISGFGMFCGYYERFKNGTISLNDFYLNRYKRLLPFFITLIMIDVVLDKSREHIVEGITESTLVFGLLPNNQPSVIGVCWTLGVLFLFYMLFPFVVYLCWTNRRAWMTFISSIILSLFCSLYYFTDKFVIESFVARHNILYCAPWIIGGGIVYMYRDAIKRFIQKYRWVWLATSIVIYVFWHVIPGEVNGIDVWMLKNLVLYLPWLMYAISVKSPILSNKVMKYLSGISLELYLAQMVSFRVIEKFHCLYLLGRGWLSFMIVWIAMITGLVFFIEVWKKLWMYIRLRSTEN